MSLCRIINPVVFFRGVRQRDDGLLAIVKRKANGVSGSQFQDRSIVSFTQMEFIMPSSIPVRIAEHLFPSLNQARLHYRDILHRYQPGQRLQEEDRLQVKDLMAGSGAALPPSGSAHVVRVVLGHYGRPCFVSNGSGESPQVISITRSIKQCVPRSDCSQKKEIATESPVPTGAH